MTYTGYPFQYLGSNTLGADQYLKETRIYIFQSQKSGHKYQVNIERYMDHLYCVKFYDLTVEVNLGKFSSLSGTYEPRTIFRTIADIALDVYQHDSYASFFFVGAADKRDQASVSTRRHRVYVSFVNDLNLSHMFRTVELKDQSMCVLVNRKAVTDVDVFMQTILDFITG